jgi:hypothetical protein
MMRRNAMVVLVLACLVAACADTETVSERRAAMDASIEEVREYIKNVKPRATGHVRYREPLRWQYLNDYFVIVEGRDGRYLVEMDVLCNDLGSASIYADMADVRDTRGLLRARHNSIRGCRIREIYKLPEDDKATRSDEGGPKGDE